MEKILVRSLVSSSQSEELYERDVLVSLGIINDELDDDYYSYEIEEVRPDEMLDDNYSNEVTPLSISELEKLLGEAKEKGATHVGIFYHSDHFQYEIYGYSYELGGKEFLEQKAKEEAVKKAKEKELQIKRLLSMAENYGIEIEIKN